MARILVVDDEELIRASITAALCRAGHQVTTAEDGADAVDKFRPGRFDLVITDIVMPRMEGIETLRALRQLEPGIRIIAMSETEADHGFYLKAAVALGADGKLEKPFTAAELRLIVEEALALPQQETAALWYRHMPDWVSPLSAPADPSNPHQTPQDLRLRNN